MSSRAATERRKAANLCVVCGARPPVEGRTKCMYCTERVRLYHKEKYESRKSQGLCPQCGEHAVVGRITCTSCLEKAKAHMGRSAQKRKEGALCRQCGSPVEVGRSCCAKCREAHSSAARVRRERNLAEGKCYACSNPRLPGVTYCVEHKQAMLERKKRHIEAGRCVYCRTSKAVVGKTMCRPCLDMVKVRGNNLRQGRAQSGLCPGCSTPLTDGRKWCPACRERTNLKTKEVRSRLRANGVCPHCCQEPLIKGRARCTLCYLKSVSARTLKDREAWPVLKDIFDRQGGRCPYTGRPLTLGVDTSIDHKVAKSKGGSDDPANLQWVFKIVNTMKWNLPEDEFLATVASIRSSRESDQSDSSSPLP
jgi:hypothetical protein